MSAKLSNLIEKLFILLLTGACGFAVTYLHNIQQSLEQIRGKMSLACEQISAIDEGMKSLQERLAMTDLELKSQRDLIDALHPRKGG